MEVRTPPRWALVAAGAVFMAAVAVMTFLGAEEEEKNSAPPPGRVWFEPTPYWQEVRPEHVCPKGLEFKMDLETGKNMARLPVG